MGLQPAVAAIAVELADRLFRGRLGLVAYLLRGRDPGLGVPCLLLRFARELLSLALCLLGCGARSFRALVG